MEHDFEVFFVTLMVTFYLMDAQCIHLQLTILSSSSKAEFKVMKIRMKNCICFESICKLKISVKINSLSDKPLLFLQKYQVNTFSIFYSYHFSIIFHLFYLRILSAFFTEVFECYKYFLSIELGYH